MAALDEFVTRAREQNGRHHDSHGESLNDLSANARQTFGNIDDTLQAASVRLRNNYEATNSDTDSLRNSVSPFLRSIRSALDELESNFESNAPMEYVITGETPQKKEWTYPSSLPRTESQSLLLSKPKGSPDAKPASSRSPTKITSPRKTGSPMKGVSSPSKLPSPTKTRIFVDDSATADQAVLVAQPTNEPAEEPKGGLREMDMNVLAQPTSTGDVHGHPKTSFSRSVNNSLQPPLKRHAAAESRLPRMGRENSVFTQSVGPGSGTGRRLRSSPQQ
jgi:kinesin family member 11